MILGKPGVGKLVLYLVCMCDIREAWCRNISLRSSVCVTLEKPGVGKSVLDLVCMCDIREACCRNISLRSSVCVCVCV